MRLPMRLQRWLSHIIFWGQLEIWNSVAIDVFLLLLDTSYDSFPLTVACLVNAYNKVQHWSFQFRFSWLTTFVCVGSRSREGIFNRDEDCLCGLGCLQTFDGLERPDAEGDVPPQKYLWLWRVANPNRAEHTDSAEIFPLIGKTVYIARDCCLGTCCWNGRSKVTLAKFCITAKRRHECAEFSAVTSKPSGRRRVFCLLVANVSSYDLEYKLASCYSPYTAQTKEDNVTVLFCKSFTIVIRRKFNNPTWIQRVWEPLGRFIVEFIKLYKSSLFIFYVHDSVHQKSILTLWRRNYFF